MVTLPFKSNTICLAVLPMPGTELDKHHFHFQLLFHSFGELAAKIAKADLGPIPVTLIKL